MEEAFVEAAYAVFETMTDLKTIAPKEKRPIKIHAEDLKALLFEWINQFLYLFDVEGLLFSQFEIKITKVGDTHELNGEGWGEHFDPQKHPPRTEIKAPTYSLMEVIQKPKNVILRFVVDV